MPADAATKFTAAVCVALRLVREHDTGYSAEDVEGFTEAGLYAFLEEMGYEWDTRGWTNAS